MQRREAVPVDGVSASARFEQRAHDVCVADVSSVVQRRAPVVVGGVDASARREQCVHRICLTRLHCVKQTTAPDATTSCHGELTVVKFRKKDGSQVFVAKSGWFGAECLLRAAASALREDARGLSPGVTQAR